MCARVGVRAPKTIDRWIKRGAFPAPTHRLGGHRVWDREVIEAWEAAEREKPRPSRASWFRAGVKDTIRQPHAIKGQGPDEPSKNAH